jgi:hypothetical protein
MPGAPLSQEWPGGPGIPGNPALPSLPLGPLRPGNPGKPAAPEMIQCFDDIQTLTVYRWPITNYSHMSLLEINILILTQGSNELNL